MIRGLHKITSLNNLRARGTRLRPRKSQIATLMILMMVAVLVLVMATVNIGQASLTATNLANAADAGALYLASQLATQSQFMWRLLGNRTQKCKKKGIASVVFAVVAAIVVTVATAGAGAGAGYVILAGAVAGAAGGAIGGEYAGTGAGKGAIQGAAIGASIGMGVAGGFSSCQVTAGGNYVAGGSTTLMTASGPTTTLVTYSVAQGVTGAALAAGANIYNASIGQKMFQDAYRVASESLNELSEYDRYREGAFLQVFLQTVDEPNEELDTGDVDQDGKDDKDGDKILPFFIWWEDRMDMLKTALEDVTPPTNTFFQRLDDTVQAISDDKCLAWRRASEGEGWKNICTFKDRSYLNLLSSSKVIYEKESIAEMAGNIHTALGSEYCTFYPDSINHIYAELRDFSTTGDQVLAELEAYGLNRLVATWNTWFPMFYDMERGEGLYYGLSELLNGDDDSESGFYGLREWLDQLDEAEKKIKEDYPECELYCPTYYDEGVKHVDCSKGFYTNSPCYLANGACSADSDLVDEIAEARVEIKKIIDGVEGFRTAISNYKDNYETAYKEIDLNPAKYSWIDSRGDLSIEVEAGPYRFSRIVSSKHGSILNRKVCATLFDHTDDGKCWVKVSRTAPANKSMGLLGKWNPAAGGEKDFTITRTSKAYYSFDKVGLSGISK